MVGNNVPAGSRLICSRKITQAAHAENHASSVTPDICSRKITVRPFPMDHGNQGLSRSKKITELVPGRSRTAISVVLAGWAAGPRGP